MPAGRVVAAESPVAFLGRFSSTGTGPAGPAGRGALPAGAAWRSSISSAGRISALAGSERGCEGRTRKVMRLSQPFSCANLRLARSAMRHANSANAKPSQDPLGEALSLTNNDAHASAIAIAYPQSALCMVRTAAVCRRPIVPPSTPAMQATLAVRLTSAEPGLVAGHTEDPSPARGAARGHVTTSGALASPGLEPCSGRPARKCRARSTVGWRPMRRRLRASHLPVSVTAAPRK